MPRCAFICPGFALLIGVSFKMTTPEYEPCPMHLEVLLPISDTSKGKCLCYLCAQLARKETYAKQKTGEWYDTRQIPIQFNQHARRSDP